MRIVTSFRYIKDYHPFTFNFSISLCFRWISWYFYTIDDFSPFIFDVMTNSFTLSLLFYKLLFPFPCPVYSVFLFFFFIPTFQIWFFLIFFIILTPLPVSSEVTHSFSVTLDGNLHPLIYQNLILIVAFILCWTKYLRIF